MSLVKQALNIPSLDEIRADGKMKCQDSARKGQIVCDAVSSTVCKLELYLEPKSKSYL